MTQNPTAGHSLAGFQVRHDFFVGIDSDGTVFDSMEIKHIQCFLPNIIQYWELQPISEYVRETAEFVNLYSPWRGVDRWTGLVVMFDLLRERPEVRSQPVKIPRLEAVRKFIQSDFSPSNNGLQQFVAGKDDPELETAWQWSQAANAAARELLRDIPPFPFVRESLGMLSGHADMVVISGTSTEVLIQEWEAFHLSDFVAAIAGQEAGRKSRQLHLAAEGKYSEDHALMIGDAPSDLKVAQEHHMLFYPINPGQEAESWKRFHTEAIGKFLDGEYTGEYESRLVKEFESLLQERPPWERAQTPKLTEKKLNGTTNFTN